MKRCPYCDGKTDHPQMVAHHCVKMTKSLVTLLRGIESDIKNNRFHSPQNLAVIYRVIKNELEKINRVKGYGDE